jgi:hypothetical protein
LKDYREKHIKKFNLLLEDKNIYKIEKLNDKYFIYYNDGSIFKCSGYLADKCIICFSKQKITGIKKLF